MGKARDVEGKRNVRDIQLPFHERGNLFFREHRISTSILDHGWYRDIALLIKLYELSGYYSIVLLQGRIKGFFIDELERDLRFHFGAGKLRYKLQLAIGIMNANR